ncbi:MAG: hypothetical protein RI967_395 [Planctomycetota bacterium]
MSSDSDDASAHSSVSSSAPSSTQAPRTGLTDLVAARLAAKAIATAVEPTALPRLAPGKSTPGPAAWRALERHAASFRLR